MKEELDIGAQIVVNQHNGDGVISLWTSFGTLLQKAMDRSIPSKLQKKMNPSHEPWESHSIRRMLKHRDFSDE